MRLFLDWRQFKGGQRIIFLKCDADPFNWAACLLESMESEPIDPHPTLSEKRRGYFLVEIHGAR